MYLTAVSSLFLATSGMEIGLIVALAVVAVAFIAVLSLFIIHKSKINKEN